jgi:hypothetical protein
MAQRKVWMRHPDAGGRPVPPDVRERTAERIRRYAEKHYAGKYTRLNIRFHGVFCYIDAYTEPPKPTKGLLEITGETREDYLQRLRNAPIHLCRLRYFGDEEKWALAYYTYSNERYELTMYPSGDFYGTPEEAFEIGAAQLV